MKLFLSTNEKKIVKKQLRKKLSEAETSVLTIDQKVNGIIIIKLEITK